MNVGDAFLAASPGSWETKHLWAVITSPDANGEQVIVNITSNGDDGSCVLQAGEHPFLKYDSVVSYKDATITNETALSDAAHGGAIQIRAPIRADVLMRMQQGALTSLQTAIGIKTMVQSELGIA